MSNIHLLPDYKEAKPPRYCPSIDAKYQRFTDRDWHQIWLEPEGHDNNVVFPNGLSTGFPIHVQQKIVNSMQGCEKAVILRPAYAVEYDCVDPQQLTSTLETKKIKSLFLAGQINGTTGYEEAASQGIVAGLNAGLKAKGEKEFVFDREQSLIGVLVDDITTSGIIEPYRMFTSRAENRMSLRPDNSYERLSWVGLKYDILSPSFKKELERREQTFSKIIENLKKTNIELWSIKKNANYETNSKMTAWDSLIKHQIDLEDLKDKVEGLEGIEWCTLDDIEGKIKYEQYEIKERRVNERTRKLIAEVDLTSFPFEQLKGLVTNEEFANLVKTRPPTLKAMSRMSGIRPTTIYQTTVLWKKLVLARELIK